MKISLITGITGQDGSYLAELLLQKGYKVYGLIRRSSSFNTSRIDHIFNKLHLIYGDLSDAVSLINCLNKIENDIENVYGDIEVIEIYNLGAMSHVKVSFETPEYTGDVCALGVLRLLEAIKNSKLKDKIRFYQASTSELYGDTTIAPQSETTPFNPCSPYAVAKLYAYYIVKNYRNAYNLWLSNGILFNHESPRRGDTFVTKKIINFVKKYRNNITKGCISNNSINCCSDDVLELGNLDSKRDWGYAKEYVYGMWLIMQQDKPDDYVLATEETHTIREFVELAFTEIGIEIRWEHNTTTNLDYGYNNITGDLLVRTNEKYYRPTEVNLLLGDCTKAHEKLGWYAQTKINDLIKIMLNE